MSEPITVTNPVVSKQWHPMLNFPLKPDLVSAGSHKRPWWYHAICGYEWQAYVFNRTREPDPEKCPVCLNKVAKAGINDLGTTDPDIAAEMHPTKNGKWTPENVCAGWTLSLTWIGKECGHEWDAEVRLRVRGSGCLVCLNRVIVADLNSLAAKAPELAAQVHPTLNGNLTAESIPLNYTKPIMWQCPINVVHIWPQTPNSRYNNDSGCPGCSGRMVFAGDKDLGTTHPTIAIEWHSTKNGELTPQQVSRGYSELVWWHGKECGHDWRDTVAHRVAGRGCAVCAGRQIHVGMTDLGTTHVEIAATLHRLRIRVVLRRTSMLE